MLRQTLGQSAADQGLLRIAHVNAGGIGSATGRMQVIKKAGSVTVTAPAELVYSGTAKRMAAQAVAKADNEKVSLQSAITDVMCSDFTYLVSFLIFFLLSMIIITVIVNIVNLNLRIPGNERLNRVGGLIAGAGVGAMFCFVVGWALRFGGAFLPESELGHTVLSMFFIRLNFLQYFLSV